MMTKAQAEQLWAKLVAGDTRIYDFIEMLSAGKHILHPPYPESGPSTTCPTRSAGSFLREWAEALGE